jgi:thiol-disulfide isomerase/thioredoxin
MVMSRRLLFAAAAALAVSSVGLAAAAAEKKPFTQDAFDAARNAGASVLVEVTAPWCPTCKAQKPILSRLATDPRFAKFVVLEVDFDSRKDVLKALGVQMQSTLVVFKGDKEMGRSTGDTDPASIEALLSRAV